jgi:hypothetical protein
MFNLDIEFHVWSILATLVLVVFYLGPIASGFRWLRGLTRGKSNQG